MRYFVGRDDREIEVDIVEKEGRLFALVDGEEIPVDLRRVDGQGSWSLLLSDASHRFTVRDDGDAVVVRLDGASHRVRVETDRDRLLRATRKSRGAPTGPREVRSDMAGIVVRVLVAPGTRVAAGDPLLIVEAMKMENEIRAPSPGVVDHVHVSDRMTVVVGTPLLTLSDGAEA